MPKHLIFIACFASLFLTSCIYKLDIQQGNIVTQAMIDQLEPNMNKRQVRYIMGTPLAVDVFHQERWDYIYSTEPGGGVREQKRISLFFKRERLAGIQGDFRPSNEPPPENTEETNVIVPKREIQKSLWEKISGLFSDDGA